MHSSALNETDLGWASSMAVLASKGQSSESLSSSMSAANVPFFRPSMAAVCEDVADREAGWPPHTAQ